MSEQIKLDGVCIFRVCGHWVMCECWDGYDGVAYGVTVLNPEGKELFHTWSTDKIDTYDKAKDYIDGVYEVLEAMRIETSGLIKCLQSLTAKCLTLMEEIWKEKRR